MSDANPAVLTVTEKTKKALGQSAPWVMFLAVMGYIGCGLLAVLGVTMIVFGDALGNLAGHSGSPIKIWPFVGGAYIGLGVVAFFPTRMLHRVAGRSRLYGLSGIPADLETVAVTIRSLALYWSICTIVLLAVYLIVAIGSVFVFLALPHRY